MAIISIPRSYLAKGDSSLDWFFKNRNRVVAEMRTLESPVKDEPADLPKKDAPPSPYAPGNYKGQGKRKPLSPDSVRRLKDPNLIATMELLGISSLTELCRLREGELRALLIPISSRYRKGGGLYDYSLMRLNAIQHRLFKLGRHLRSDDQPVEPATVS